jgi:hypothetical protein
MPGLLSTNSHRLGDYFASNWPRLWKSRVDLCLWFSILGVVLGMAAWVLEPTVQSVNAWVAAKKKAQFGQHSQTSFDLGYYIIGSMVVLLAIAGLAWIRATRRALVLRSLAFDRFSPRLTFVLIGVAAILGGLAASINLFGLVKYQDAVMVMSLFVLLIAYLTLLSEWYSLRELLIGLLVVLAVLILLVVPLGQILEHVAPGMGNTLLKWGMTLVCGVALAIVLSSLFRGSRGRLIRPAMMLSMLVLPPAIGFGALALKTWMSSGMALASWPSWLSTDTAGIVTFVVGTLLAAEAMCWLGGKVDVLPERK